LVPRKAVHFAVLDGLFEEAIETIRDGFFPVILIAAANFAADKAEEVLSVSADREDANSRSRRDAEWLEEAAWTLNDLAFEYMELRLPKT
jgi:hypothetical protein